MSYLPPEKKKRTDGASPARITIWVVAGAVGLYLVGTGVFGILSPG